MNKKIIPFIIAIPALFLLFIFRIVPAFTSFIISTKDFMIVKGLFGSPGIGAKNYSSFFQSPVFIKLVLNTLTLNILSIALTCILAAAMVICIFRMPNKWFKLAAIIIVSLPAFIPITSFVSIFMAALSPDKGFINNILMQMGMERSFFFADPLLYPLLFAVMDSLRNIYIPVIIGVLVCEEHTNIRYSKIAFVIFGYIAVKVTMLLSPDIENILITYNPLVYGSADVLDTFTYRTGLLQNQFGVSSAIWVTKTIAQLLLNIGIYFVLTIIVPVISGSIDKLSDRVNRGWDSIIGIIGYVLLAIGSIIVLVLAFVPSSKGMFEAIKQLLMHKEFASSVFNSMIYCIFSCGIYGFITITLAFPLTVKTKFYPFFLVIIMSLTNNIIGEYYIFKALGTINTVLPVIIGSSMSVMGAFALYFSISRRFGDHMPDIGEYIKASILPLVTIVSLFFIANWGSYIYQLVYTANRSLTGVSLFGMQVLFRQNVSGSSTASSYTIIENTRSAFIFLSSIIPVSLGAILICLSKFLPLSAFGAQIRKG